MPNNYTDEIERDVIAVAKQGSATQRQIAKHFGVSKSALSTWMRVAEFQERGLSGPAAGSGG